jgi:drug/metabolite transporter (DMT)-like permease
MMPLWLAYWCVVFIWATTPIGVASSNHSLHFLEAGGLRMLLAALILLILCRILKKPLLPNRQVLKTYAVASIGLFPNMALVYWGAQYVPSGVLSVMFAFNPVVIGVLSWLVLKDNPFTLLRTLAIILSITGIGVIYVDQLNVSAASALGIVALLTAVIGWGVSTIWLLKMNIKVEPLCQTAGASIFALPGYLICWLLLDGTVPTDISMQSMLGVGYLSMFGSVVGFSLYFYILTNMPVMSVSLITLMSPVLALIIGAVFANEKMSTQLIIGSAIVLASLLLYQAAPIIKRLQRKPPLPQSSSSSSEGGQ